MRMLASTPGIQLTPGSLAEGISRAAAKLRAPDQAALASAQNGMSDAPNAMTAVVVGGRTTHEQRDALIWAVVLAMGLTTLLLALGPMLIGALWPAAAEDRAAAVLRKKPWEAGIELMASGDPVRWQQLVAADGFQHETAQEVAICWSRADSAGKPIHCSIEIAPSTAAMRVLPRP